MGELLMRYILLAVFFISTLLPTAGIAADMRVTPAKGDPLEDRKQYYAEINCHYKFDRKHLSSKYKEYLSRLDKDGQYKNGNFGTRRNKAYHAISIASGVSNKISKASDLINFQVEFPNTIQFFPLFRAETKGGILNRRVTQAKLWDELCKKKSMMIAGGKNLYLIPIFIHSDEETENTIIGALANTILGLVPPTAAAIFSPIKAKSVTDDFNVISANTTKLISAIESAFVGPKATITQDDPYQLRLGKTTVSTELTTITITISSDPSFLLGKSEFKGNQRHFETYRPASRDISTVEKIKTYCRTYNGTLYEAGITSDIDRAYILHQDMLGMNTDPLDTVRCLRLAGEKVALAAVASKNPRPGQNSSDHKIFYGSQPRNEITPELHSIYVNQYKHEFTVKVPTSQIDNAELSQLNQLVIEFLNSDYRQIRNSEDKSKLLPNLAIRMDSLFAPLVKVDDQTADTRFWNKLSDVAKTNGAISYEAAKLIANEFRDIRCLLAPSDFKNSNDNLKRIVIGSGHFALIAKPKTVKDSNQLATFVQLVFTDANFTPKLSLIKTGDISLKTIDGKGFCLSGS